MQVNEMRTFGDVRRMMLDTIVALRDDKMGVDRGMAIAANFKVLNDNILAEVAAAKMSHITRAEAHSFGQVVAMGQRSIGGGEYNGKQDQGPPRLAGVEA